MNLLEITIGKKRETANRVKYNLANSRNRQKWRDQFPDFLKAEKFVDDVEMSRFKKTHGKHGKMRNGNYTLPPCNLIETL